MASNKYEISSRYQDKLDSILAFYQARNPGEEITISDVLHSMIYNFPTDNANRAPIYSDMYVLCGAGESGAFQVEGVDEEDGGVFFLYMRKISVDELTEDTRLYCEVKHATTYPYSAIDFVEVFSNEAKNFIKSMRFLKEEPRQFCRAGLVVTPQMNLI